MYIRLSRTNKKSNEDRLKIETKGKFNLFLQFEWGATALTLFDGPITKPTYRGFVEPGWDKGLATISKYSPFNPEQRISIRFVEPKQEKSMIFEMKIHIPGTGKGKADKGQHIVL